MIVSKTDRLLIRHFQLSDAEFILTLLNDSSFIKNIGDKQVREHADALSYLSDGPISSYDKYGFGLNLVTLKDSGVLIGMCGLLKREEFDFVDLGYALLPQYCSKGYAKEAAIAVLKDANINHRLTTVAAITSPDNAASNHLLKALGFTLEGNVLLYDDENNLYKYNFCN
ncbi:MAG: GNAT family N-acetyltransferase [Colwellia sp.]|nr:GNAT family N-acetyltransferase [Colwellia sp.]MCW8863253.1 GNAT family N-acetyltransferase [Colwellia sp.]MCW9081229.1 GNAT family N-acetyltransferase [Colwellia sp.]